MATRPAYHKANQEGLLADNGTNRTEYDTKVKFILYLCPAFLSKCMICFGPDILDNLFRSFSGTAGFLVATHAFVYIGAEDSAESVSILGPWEYGLEYELYCRT